MRRARRSVGEDRDNIRLVYAILHTLKPSPNTIMGILGALGLALTIIVLKVCVPEIFQAIEVMIISFLHTMSVMSQTAGQVAGSASAFPL